VRTLLLVASLAGIVVGCGDGNVVSAPTPSSSVPSFTAPPSGWIGDATVLSSSGPGGCGWGRTPGDTHAGVLWGVSLSGSTVSLDQDLKNWPTDHIPYSGTVSGLQFTASYSQPISGVCQFAGATLSGTFTTDLSAFDAMETLTWGEGASRTTVQRRWQVRRNP
jgi:hypothetical protein